MAALKAREGVPATERQIEFVHELLREVHGEWADSVFRDEDDRGTFNDRRLTSGLIDTLIEARKAARRKAGAAADRDVEWPEAGYYCATVDGVLRFFRVKAGKGRWEGRFFLDRFKSDELGRVSRAERDVVLRQINADPLGAAMLFARETVRCRLCAKRLTDAESRAAGIGPDCAGRR